MPTSRSAPRRTRARPHATVTTCRRRYPPRYARNAELFCAEREALVGRIDALVRARRSGLVRNAYLVEALEETARDFDRLPGAKSLYVFSDMMQHARWFSHLDTGWGGWDFEAFAARRDERAVLAGASPAPGPDWYTRIFYLHRKDITERPDAQQAHRQFWERYFNERGPAEPQLAGVASSTSRRRRRCWTTQPSP